MTTAQERRRFLAGVASAYGRTGAAGSTGPVLVYDRLARALVAASPVPLAGRTVVDVGAGTGAASLAVVAAGGRAVALDLAPPMPRAHRAPVVGAIAGEATALPVGDATVDGVVAAFSLNHLPDPVDGFREARRVCRPGSAAAAAVDRGLRRHHLTVAAMRPGGGPLRPPRRRARHPVGWPPAPVPDVSAPAGGAEPSSAPGTTAEPLPDGSTGTVPATVPTPSGCSLASRRIDSQIATVSTTAMTPRLTAVGM